ncbi:hypothetical protein DL764_009755 [Monosporascus ibericus]|uniref:Uncharacterized protein n=1 Tax=Monosporascus ibericus TaxID=155417 RepID=A0A4Q4SU80_9PEZI|nr:hypothetical protein DL764_009755 [Monosporascus ibericus]
MTLIRLDSARSEYRIGRQHHSGAPGDSEDGAALSDFVSSATATRAGALKSRRSHAIIRHLASLSLWSAFLRLAPRSSSLGICYTTWVISVAPIP